MIIQKNAIQRYKENLHFFTQDIRIEIVDKHIEGEYKDRVVKVFEPWLGKRVDEIR